MHKKVWKDEEGVSPVIATILMVAITVVLAGVLVVYMQQFSNPTQTQNVTGSFVATPFSNPHDGTTVNGGGWYVKVQSLSGGNPQWGDMTLIITKGGVTYTEMIGVKPTVSDLEYTTTTPEWYLKQSPGSTMNYAEAGVATAISGNEANVNAGEFETIQGAYLVVVDNDGDGKLTNTDVVYIYKDHNSDSVVDLEGGSITFKTTAGEIGTTNLN